MAIFGKKKGDDDASGVEAPQEVAAAFSPEKAATFFKHAQATHDSGNHEYAMQHWLNGLRQDPTSEAGLNGFLTTAAKFNESSKKGPSKETRSAVTHKGPVGKYVLALLDYGTKPGELSPALKAAELAGGLGLRNAAQYLGTRAFDIVLADPKKQKKDTFVKLMDVFETIEVYDLAVQAGNAAVRVDNTDNDLNNRVRNLSAQATMNKGGFEDSGQEGGFRKNIRDADKQRELDEAERISKTADVKDRVLLSAEEDYKARPDDVATIEKYGRALRERGKNSDELKAITLYNDAYKATGQFKFRQASGEIQIRRARREVLKAKQALQENPDNEEAKMLLSMSERSMLDLELRELTMRVEKYPTDLALKYELGLRFYQDEKFNEAIEQFQQAQDDAKLRRLVLLAMGRSFMKLGGWLDEAVSTFRGALEGIEDPKSDLGLEIRYELMASLHEKAADAKSVEAAEEADQLAGGIAIQSFGYKDIRERREAIKALMAELKG